MSVPGHSVPDNNTEYVKEAEATYNVQVKFSSRPKLNSSVVVKGSEKEAEKVQDAARQLCLYMCGNVSTCKQSTCFTKIPMKFNFNFEKKNSFSHNSVACCTLSFHSYFFTSDL